MSGDARALFSSSYLNSVCSRRSYINSHLSRASHQRASTADITFYGNRKDGTRVELAFRPAARAALKTRALAPQVPHIQIWGRQFIAAGAARQSPVRRRELFPAPWLRSAR